MLRLKVKNHLTDKELREKMKQEKSIKQFKIWQCIYIVQSKKDIRAEQVSDLIQISKYSVYHYVENYNRYGPIGVIIKAQGGRRRSYLKLEEEKELLKKISDKALQGLILTALDMRDEVEKKIGKKVSDDYLWDLFHRHGWKKKAPRPSHPRSNKREQEGFKKNLKKSWKPVN